MTRIEQALRKSLAEYGIAMDDYRFHVESVYPDEPKLVRSAVFYRPSDGAAIRVDNIYVDRSGWPAQWDQPELTAVHETIMRGYMEADTS